jgi:type I restriction enzyme M protein
MKKQSAKVENPVAETVGDSATPPITLPDGKFIDFIDGTVRNKTPEEYVRQNFARSLVQEFRYPRNEIAVEFSIKVGSSKKRVDLAVFEEGKPREQQHIILLAECKKEGTSSADRTEGVAQLKSYMAACINARFGLWTNGSDERLAYRKDEKDRKHEFAEIVDIPKKGDEGKDTDVPDRLNLRAASADNLLFAFRRCHNYIAGNQGLQKAESFWELLKVIFCKIEDERSLDSLSFYVTSKEVRYTDGQLKCRKRLGKLFAAVRSKYATIFKPTEEIELNNEVLAYVVSQLQGFSLLGSQVDVKGVAYEEIVGSNLRGDRGEFFTPRNACRMAVEMIDPGPKDRILDPACGTGGFLVTAMNAVLKKIEQGHQARWANPARPSQQEWEQQFRARDEIMRRNVVGLDLNPVLVRAAKMNMVMNNDGSGGMTQADSLKDPVTWSPDAQVLAPLGSFDLVFTNPPFGTKIRIDNPTTLAQYDLAAQWDWVESSDRWVKRLDSSGQLVLQGSLPPEILFIERCVQFLKPGSGKMAMVVPNGILNNPPLAYVRQWLLDNTQVLAIVDMQRDLFQPKNDTQTSMVLLRRFSPRELVKRPDYPIFMAVTNRIGHDKRGAAIYVRDVDGTDVLSKREIRTKLVEGGKIVEKVITELVPEIDDHLPLIAPAYQAWRREHGL